VSQGSPFNVKAMKTKENMGSLQSVKSALVFQENSGKNRPTYRKRRRFHFCEKFKKFSKVKQILPFL
jgi:hypothetical protein